jgi:type III pantothenate kinase
MLLAVDIGNTNTVVGLFAGATLLTHWRLTTERQRMPDEWWALLAPLLLTGGYAAAQIDGAIIDSSVPTVTAAIREMCERHLGRRPLVVSLDLDLGVRALVDNPRSVGPDRLANAVAAHALYPGPAIVIDFGTATTFDVVSAEGDFLGGAIAPGLGLAFDALTSRAAMLYAIELAVPARAIGTSTVTNMQSGTVLGYVGLVEGLVSRMSAELGRRPTVIATGGLSGIIAAATPVIDHHEPFLTLYGLRLIYERNARPAAPAAEGTAGDRRAQASPAASA